MPLTVADEIAEVLIARLETLIGGDEQTDVVEVIRPKRLGDYTPKDLQIVVTQSNPERVTELDCPGNPPAICWQQTYNIRCHLMPSEDDDTAIDQLCNQFAADVIKVVCTPSNDWHLFDNYAIDAQIQTIENIETGEGMDGVNVPIAIMYRVSENDPYTVRA
jgi:hypothetical protein